MLQDFTNNIIYCQGNDVKEKINICLIITLIFLLATSVNAATKTPIDSTTIRVGIKSLIDFTTLRLQSFSGNWSAVLYPTNATGSKKISKPINEIIEEGEDICVSLVRKGIIARLSGGAELSAGYKKVVITGGELISLEIPNMAPILFVGSIEIISDPPTLMIVNTLTFRQFITSTISELIPCLEPEAIKALIVMARTRLMYLKQANAHPDEPFDICDKDHCMEFNGAGRNRELVSLIVPVVKNEHLLYKKKLFMPRFHLCCGGKISSAKDVFGTDEPYHTAIIDKMDKGRENCFHSPWFSWSLEVSKHEILEFLSIEFAGGADRIYSAWQPSAIDGNGRITKVILRGRRPKEIPGFIFLEKIKSYLGANAVKAMKFNMDILKRTIVFRGMGKGIGVGMCIYGADGMAKKGKKYTDILKFYYPGTDLSD